MWTAVSEPEDHVSTFTDELLRTGLMLSGLAADLVEVLPAEHYPAEEPGVVVIEMIAGTISTVLADTDEDEVARATQLIRVASDRVLEHLRLALELSRRGRDAENLDGSDGTLGCMK
jgi:hypothetical protein